MFYVIFDLEWNNAYDYKQKKGMNEIIEIGAIKLDEKLNIVDTFKQLISPKLSKKLSSRFKNLTHITMQEIENSGIPFEDAFSDFARWSSGENSVFLSWSNSDLYVLVDNFKKFEALSKLDFINMLTYRNIVNPFLKTLPAIRSVLRIVQKCLISGLIRQICTERLKIVIYLLNALKKCLTKLNSLAISLIVINHFLNGLYLNHIILQKVFLITTM